MAGYAERAVVAILIRQYCVETDRGQVHPRMAFFVPRIQAVQDDLAPVTGNPVVQLHLQMIGHTARLHPLAELVLEVIGGKRLAWPRFLEPRRHQVLRIRDSGFRAAVLRYEAELDVAQFLVQSAKFQRRLTIIVKSGKRRRAQAQRFDDILEAARIFPEIGDHLRASAADFRKCKLHERGQIPEWCGGAAVHEDIERAFDVLVRELERGAVHDQPGIIQQRHGRVPEPAGKLETRSEEVVFRQKCVFDDPDAPPRDDAILM